MKWLALLLTAVLGLGVCALGQTTQSTTQARADLTLKLTTEEGKKQVQAILQAQGKPVENATIEFFVSRTFGNLSIGKDQTLDDGSAAVPFPADLPGNASGELQITALVQTPLQYAGTSVHEVFGGATVVSASTEPFPRALWAPNAPFLLIVTIAGLLAAVWCTYAYVVGQLWALAKGR